MHDAFYDSHSQIEVAMCGRRKPAWRGRFRRQTGNVYTMPTSHNCVLQIISSLAVTAQPMLRQMPCPSSPCLRRARRPHRTTRLGPSLAAPHVICVPPRRRLTARCAARLAPRPASPHRVAAWLGSDARARKTLEAERALGSHSH